MVRSAARAGLRRVPVAGRAVARALERVGRTDLAARVMAASQHPEQVTVALPGTRSTLRMWRLDGRDQVARALAAHGWSGFEPPLPDCIAALLRSAEGMFIDVGANTGFYTLVATAARTDVTVIAFEPVPEIADLMQANLALNRAGRRVELRRCAVSDEAGNALLHLPPPQADGTVETSASLEADFKEIVERAIEVPVHTLDALWIARGRPPVAVVKVDVEGAEPKVLAGARELISTCRPVVTVEVLGRLDEAPLERLRDDLDLVDVCLRPDHVYVAREVAVDAEAPNHLLVPREALDATLERLTDAGLTVHRSR